MTYPYYIGLMSGTSADAIDAVLIEAAPQHFELCATHTHPLPDAYRQAVLHLSQSDAPVYPWQIAALDQETADLCAEAVNCLLSKSSLTPAEIQAIGSHGQTLYHLAPQQARAEQRPFTWQIGDPNRLAYRTGIPVVADFRRKDMAAGGQGAPLVPAFHAALLRHPQENRAVLNIGGIANLTLLPADTRQPVQGFDTGPGNALLDAWAQRHLQQPLDAKGAWAAGGEPLADLLARCLSDPYFALPAPKSTGRDYFNLKWLEQHLSDHSIAPQAVQATLLHLTVHSISQAVRPFQPQRLLVCGGGVHNEFLMQQLQTQLAQIPVESTAAQGVEPDWVEASCFAWLAQQRLLARPGNLPSVTGATTSLVLGGLYLPA